MFESPPMLANGVAVGATVLFGVVPAVQAPAGDADDLLTAGSVEGIPPAMFERPPILENGIAVTGDWGTFQSVALGGDPAGDLVAGDVGGTPPEMLERPPTSEKGVAPGPPLLVGGEWYSSAGSASPRMTWSRGRSEAPPLLCSTGPRRWGTGSRPRHSRRTSPNRRATYPDCQMGQDRPATGWDRPWSRADPLGRDQEARKGRQEIPGRPHHRSRHHRHRPSRSPGRSRSPGP